MTTPPQAAAFPPPNGGNCTTRGSDTPATRGRRASCSAKPPSPPARRVLGEPASLTAGPAGSGDTAASQISHVIYLGHFSRHPKNVAIPTRQIQCLNKPWRNYVRSCWLTARTEVQAATRRHWCRGHRRARLRCPWAAGPGQATHIHPARLEAAAGPAGPGRTTSRRAEQHQPRRPHRCEGCRRDRGGPGCSARGRRRGLAGQRGDAQPHISDQAPLVWRAPEGPEGTGGLRGAAPNEVRTPSLAGGRDLRRPEHPWGHKQHQQSGRPPPTARPAQVCGKPRPADAGRGFRYPVGYEV